MNVGALGTVVAGANTPEEVMMIVLLVRVDVPWGRGRRVKKRHLRITKMLVFCKNFEILILQILFRKLNTIFCKYTKDIRLLIENTIKNVLI